MNVLGIADNHDSGAAVVVDDRLVSAVNQERLDRNKNSGAFPWQAIDEALRVAGLRERDVDRIVFGTAFTPSTALRAAGELHRRAREQGGAFSPLLHAYVVYQSVLRETGLHTWEVDASRALLRRRLRARPFRAELDLLDHHRAHAESAWRTFGADPCLVLTLDAMGDGTTATVHVGRDGQLDLLWRQSGLASINTFYARVTEVLGFTPNRHEGKVTGLAAYADPPDDLLREMRARVGFRRPGFTRMRALRPERPDDPFWASLARRPREEVAAAAQRVLEEVVCTFVDHWTERTGIRRVAVAGGTFANVKLNMRVAERVDELWVVPHMGDGGLAVGAALAGAGTAPAPLRDAFLGPGWKDAELYRALRRAGVAPNRIRNLRRRAGPGGLPGDVARVAELLAEGRVVGRFEGRMEWGPRALGHRSVLAPARDVGVTALLNERLRRSEFMPFAPIVRAEDAPRWFRDLDRAPRAARFMTVAFEVTDEFRRLAPAAVHVDGTARPQVLDRDVDPALHALLGAYGERTGAAVLINTSFNLHEEPIVCTPDDAVRAWRRARLDALWMGPYVVEGAPPRGRGPATG